VRLNPQERRNWHGFVECLQPPPGYRLAAALGTSFGLSTDALIAALLAMVDADGESLAGDPVAGVLAVTRLRDRVRVLVHPGTISGAPDVGTRRFVALLDRLILEVQPHDGLFHPKVWALRFHRLDRGQDSSPADLVRVIVGSRNLSSSSAFELGLVLEGTPADDAESINPFSADVAAALQEWLAIAKGRVPQAVLQLPAFIRKVTFEVPPDGAEHLRLRWQGTGRHRLAERLPQRLRRAVVVAPFIRSDFLSVLATRTDSLQVVSTGECLDALDDATYARLAEIKDAQGAPVLYQVNDYGDPEEAYIDGVHAKLLIVEDHRGVGTTLLGSANATGPGWGTAGPTNVEAMAELRPGIGIDGFVSGFIRENKRQVHGWVAEYDRSLKAPLDTEREAERRVLAALRDVAKLDLALRYDPERQQLLVRRVSTRLYAALLSRDDLRFEFAPLLLADDPAAWRPVQELTKGDVDFSLVPVEKLTAFLALRVTSLEPAMSRIRLVLGRLDAADLLDRRDELIEQDIIATADPAAVLAALVHGLGRLRSVSSMGEHRVGAGKGESVARLLEGASLERLLLAVAIDPTLMVDMKRLLGPIGGSPFQRLCDDLQDALRQVGEEVDV
jgi:hypothetical protein